MLVHTPLQPGGWRGHLRRRVGPGGAGCQSFGVASLYRYLATAPRSAVAPGRVVSDHAGGFPVAGQHDFRGGRAARRQFGREPDPATVRRQSRLDAGHYSAGATAERGAVAKYL